MVKILKNICKYLFPGLYCKHKHTYERLSSDLLGQDTVCKKCGWMIA